MISVISMNEKFKPISPNDMIKKLLDSKYAKGIEMYVDPDDKELMDYTDILVEACRDNNLLFQIHGNSEFDLDKQKKFMDKLASYSDILGYPINVVMHSLMRESNEESIKESQDYLGELLEYIDPNKIKLSVENLNDSYDCIRLDKTEFIPIMYNYERLYMTYDVGHDIADHGNITDLDPLLYSRLSNVHLHAIDALYNEGYDHKPINDEDPEQFQQVLKGILFLKSLKYDGPITYEYDVYQCDGDTLEEQVDNYIKSIDDTTEHFGE